MDKKPLDEDEELWQNEDSQFYEFDDDEDDLLEPHEPRKMGFVDYVIVILLVLAFSAFSLSSIPFSISSRYNFFEENQQLKTDQLVNQSIPAVVYISIEGASGSSQGTGFNIRPEGRIITNRHVVESGGAIHVAFSDGRTFLAESYTPVEGADMAYLDLHASGLPYIEIDQTRMPVPDETVTIIGNPLGFRLMSQRGTVRNYYRLTTMDFDVFDIDIAANPGNSGSPVIDDQGRAVGIVFAITSIETANGRESRTLAIPLAAVKW